MLAVIRHLEKNFKDAIGSLDLEVEDISFEIAKDISYGDICTSIACQLASKYKTENYKLAQQIVDKLGKIKYVDSIRAEKNGFINLSYSSEVFEEYYDLVLSQKEELGKQPSNKQWRFIEVVSANPTGLLHIGHARNGIFSDTLGNLLEYAGYFVYREYLVNNLGNQIRELVESIWIKYKLKFFNTHIGIKLNEVKYNGPEIDECVDHIIMHHKDRLLAEEDIYGSSLYEEVKKIALDYFLLLIKEDLDKYKIDIGKWRYESDFVNNASINDLLKGVKNHIDFREGAVWFSGGDFLPGQKSEVLIKSDGLHTYFCQDLIYHNYKLNLLGQSGEIINILGSDHQGHISKLRSYLIAINSDERVKFVVLQLVQLVEGRNKLRMSKRDSTVIHIRDLEKYMSYEEVRWFFVSQPSNSYMEIDVGLLKEKNYNNPVYYVMYAYSRISHIFQKAGDNQDFLKPVKFENINVKERELLNHLVFFEDTLINAAQTFSPNKINQYLFKLAQLFHSYYEETPILNTEEKRDLVKKLALLNAIKNTISSGLSILKIKVRDEL